MIDRINGRLALLLATAGVLLIVLVGWYALVSPQRSKAAALDAQIGDTELKLDSTQSFLASPAARQGPAQLRSLRVAIPDDARMSDILRQLSSAAGKTGVRINGITPSPLVPTSGGQALPIALIVEGHYFGIAKFMHLLRAQADVTDGKVRAEGRLFTVDTITFSSSDKKGLITATLALNAFVSGAAAPVMPGAASDTTTTTATTTTGP